MRLLTQSLLEKINTEEFHKLKKEEIERLVKSGEVDKMEDTDTFKVLRAEASSVVRDVIGRVDGKIVAHIHALIFSGWLLAQMQLEEEANDT